MATTNSPQTPINEQQESTAEAQKKMVEEIKVQWKLLWSQRFNDKVRAEGISVSDYAILHVERGTIIHATRDFKALSFKEILEKNMIDNSNNFNEPDVHTGGWNKFIKTEITNRKLKKSNQAALFPQETRKNTALKQQKKSGRGWLHTA
jgi:hypothetical protein